MAVRGANQAGHAEAGLPAAWLAAIVESSDDAIVSKTLDGTIVSWNVAAEQIFGYSAAEMVGSSVYLLIPPDLYAEEQEILGRIARGEKVAQYDTTRIRKDGRVIPVELTVSPIRDSTGTIIGASSIKRDITERKRTAEALVRLAAIVESSDDAIISKTLGGTILSWNAAAQRMFGYTAAEIVGDSIYVLVPETRREEEQDILERLSRGEHVAHYETTRLRSDGAETQVALTISPLYDATGAISGASSIMRDISERKRAEEALRHSAKMEAIGRLAGGLAHDFNNQLQAVSGFANFVARDPGLSAAGRQDLLQIQNAAERMASLTRQLLAFARQQVLTPETIDINAAVADTYPMLERLVGTDVEIELALAPGPKWVRVDRSQLVQVLLNLVTNARDAMPRGGRLVLRTDTQEVGPGQLLDRLGSPVDPGAYAELVAADSGEGIPPEHLPRIFEPFYTTKDVGKGTGLGLATLEGIISQSRGHIRVESAVGRGTTIRILLPLTTAPAATALAGFSAEVGRRSRQRLLVVDDEDLVRTVVTRTLQAEGYEVIDARHGRDAINRVEQVDGKIDLVISDLVMPVMGGRELAEELERRYPGVPLVWMSGHPREVGLGDAEAGEDRPFLQKPISPQVLLRTVTQMLQGRSIRG